MSWGEAYRLTTALSRDTTSQVAVALAGWDYPISREAIVLMDLYDLQHQSKAKRKPKPYPRPWPDRERRTFGRTSMSREELRAILDKRRSPVPPV